MFSCLLQLPFLLRTNLTNSIAKATNSIANGTNSIAKPTNSIANGTNSIATATNSIANGTNSIAKSPNSIAKTCIIIAVLHTLINTCCYKKEVNFLLLLCCYVVISSITSLGKNCNGHCTYMASPQKMYSETL